MAHDDQIAHFSRLVRDGMRQGMTRRAFLRRGLAMGLSLPVILGIVERRDLVAATATPTATPVPTVRFAMIGDFGMAGEPAAAVAAMVKGWEPDFIVTTGDNNYPAGSSKTLDANVGQYYSAYLSPYQGKYGTGGEAKRFFPVLGNHDWDQGLPRFYLRYFDLPGNGRYYTIDRDPVMFFFLDSALDEPDGVRRTSKQALWLQEALAAAPADRWKLVVFHHPPYSSGHHGSARWMRWPFREWGADAVITGHDHNYERLTIDGLPYMVNGLGGGSRYAPGSVRIEESHVFFNKDHGAMRVAAETRSISFEFVTRAGKSIDTFALTR